MPDTAPSTPPPSLKRRLILALLAAFVCGAAAGGGAVWWGGRCGVPSFSHGPHDHGPGGGPPPGRPEDMPVRLADKICSELGIAETLREPIRQIFRDGFAETEPIRRRGGEEMKAVFTRQNERIKALLTPEQKVRFEALLAEWEKHHGPPHPEPKDGKDRPPPGAPGPETPRPRPPGGSQK